MSFIDLIGNNSFKIITATMCLIIKLMNDSTVIRDKEEKLGIQCIRYSYCEAVRCYLKGHLH